MKKQKHEALISHSNTMRSFPLYRRPEPHHEAEAGASQRQDTKEEYWKLGFQTSHGLEWFKLSPETLVRCLIDSELYLLRTAPTDDIDFEAVLSTKEFIVDLEEQTSSDLDSKSLPEAVDTAVEEGIRQRLMIRRVIKDMLEQRHAVSNAVLEQAEALLDNKIRELGVEVSEKWDPRSLSIKVRPVLSKYTPFTKEYRQVLLPKKCFFHSSSERQESRAKNFTLPFEASSERIVIIFSQQICSCPTGRHFPNYLPCSEKRPCFH